MKFESTVQNGMLNSFTTRKSVVKAFVVRKAFAVFIDELHNSMEGDDTNGIHI